MSSATRGTVLAGRYRLLERTHSSPDGAQWRAVDSTLDRQVSIKVMPPGHPFTAAAADAARRVALIDDVRLVRVLDVGHDGDIGFVVSENVDGDTLAALVERSPLAPPVVRRIVGEVAQGLAGAAARGLHHLQLTPRSVIVCRDGSVKIFGTAVEAAAAGLEPDHAATATRKDSIALIALLYSGLTGRWPLGTPGFPPAPRGDGGGPVPPADLVPGIPNDLDTLCVVTLGAPDDGPRTPTEVATELAPWPSAEEAPLRAAARRLPAEGPTGPPGPDSPLKIRPTKRNKSGRSAGATPPRATPPRAAAGTEATGAAAAGAAAAAADAAKGGDAGTTPRRSASLFPTPSVAATGSLPIPKEPAGGGPRRMDSLFTQQTVYPGTATPQTSATPAEAEPGTDPATPPGASEGRMVPAAIRAIPPISVPTLRETLAATETTSRWGGRSAQSPAADRPTEVERPAVAAAPTRAKSDPPAAKSDPVTARSGPAIAKSDSTGPAEQADPTEQTDASEQTEPAPPRTAPAKATNQSPVGPLVPWGPAWQQGSEPPSAMDATGPFPILIPAEAPPREQSRLVIFSITVVLVLGLLVAAFSLRDLGSSDTATPSEVGTPLPSSTADGVTPTTDAVPETTEPAPTTASPSAAPSVPVSIAAIRSIDPQGDGDEGTSRSPAAVDGDDSTEWYSQTYNSAQFGGLKKGVGLALKLKKAAVVTSATIEFSGTDGAVELRTADSPDYSESERVGKAKMKSESVTIEADDAKPAKYVILWFTKLPSVGGTYKVEVSEVRLK